MRERESRKACPKDKYSSQDHNGASGHGGDDVRTVFKPAAITTGEYEFISHKNPQEAARVRLAHYCQKVKCRGQRQACKFPLAPNPPSPDEDGGKTKEGGEHILAFGYPCHRYTGRWMG